MQRVTQRKQAPQAAKLWQLCDRLTSVTSAHTGVTATVVGPHWCLCTKGTCCSLVLRLHTIAARMGASKWHHLLEQGTYSSNSRGSSVNAEKLGAYMQEQQDPVASTPTSTL